MATTSFRTLLALIAKFDLETFQIDVINTFVYTDLDELVYMKNSPGFPAPGTVLKLNKALYSLRRSPLLWQTMFIGALKTRDSKRSLKNRIWLIKRISSVSFS